jgi:hypothetical protein
LVLVKSWGEECGRSERKANWEPSVRSKSDDSKENKGDSKREGSKERAKRQKDACLVRAEATDVMLADVPVVPLAFAPLVGFEIAILTL